MVLRENGKRVPERRDDNVEDIYGESNDVRMCWETSDADAHYFNLVLTGVSRNFIISEDRNIDWGHAASTNPTLWIHSSDSADTSDYLSFAHDQTNSVITSGNGAVVINATALLPDANDAYALGAAATSYSDLFLASGGVINWNNGNTTLSHVNGKGLALAFPSITVSSTQDYGLLLTQELNGPTAQGGTQTYSCIDLSVTGTNVTAWDNVYLINLKDSTSTVFNMGLNGETNIILDPTATFNFVAATARTSSADDAVNLTVNFGADSTNGLTVIGTSSGDFTDCISIVGSIASGGMTTALDLATAYIATISDHASDVATTSINAYCAEIGTDNSGAGVFNAYSTEVGFDNLLFSLSGNIFFLDYSPSVLSMFQTAITAATEAPNITYSTTGNKTWAAGAGPLAAQREYQFLAPTLAGDAGGALTITSAATCYINAAPVQGANMTLSNSYALWVDAGLSKFDGNVSIGTGTLNASTLYVAGYTNDATGGLRLQDVETDATNKVGRIKIGHYTNAEEPVTSLFGYSWTSSSVLNWGGGSSSENAVTQHLLYAAANNTTLTGTIKMAVTSSGVNFGTGTVPTHPITMDSTSSQTGIALYNTADQTTNYERGTVSWDTNVFTIRNSIGGTGTARALQLKNVQSADGVTTATYTINRGGSSFHTWDFGSNTTVSNIYNFASTGGNIATTGTKVFMQVTPVYNQASGTAANTDLLINRTETAVGTGAQNFIDCQIATVSKFSVSNKGNTTITQSIVAGGTPTALTVTGGAHTTLITTVEDIGINFNMSATKTWATGAIATQREIYIQAPTYAFVGASTITNAATLAISGAPIAGANATITASAAIWAQAGQYWGAYGSTSAPTYSFASDPDTGLYATIGVLRFCAGGERINIADTGILSFNSGIKLQSSYNAGTSYVNLYIDGAGTQAQSFQIQNDGTSGFSMNFTADGANAGGPNSYIFAINGSGLSSAGQTASVERVFLSVPTGTVTWPTGALALQRHVVIAAPTYAFAGASTITDAATFYISAAPIAGANATITNAYALWVDAGLSRFDGNLSIAADDAEIQLGAGTDVRMVWETADADAHYFNIAIPNVSRNIIISEDAGIDWGHATSTNPTLFVHSSDSTDSGDWISFSHDQTNGIINVGNGVLSIPTSTTFTFGASEKVLLDASSTAHTDGAGVLDINLSTATGGVDAIDISTTLTGDVDLVTGVNVAVNGFVSGCGSYNTTHAYRATLDGDNNDTNHSYTAFTAAYANKNGGTSEMIAFEVITGYDYCLLSNSGNIEFTDYNATILAFTESAGNGNNLTLQAGDAVTSGVGGSLKFAPGAGASDDDGLIECEGNTIIANEKRLIVGGTTPITTASFAPDFQVLGTGAIDSSILLGGWTADGGGPEFHFLKSRETTIGSYAIVQDNDVCGSLRWYPDDGVDYATLAAEFRAEVDDASPAAGDIGMAFVWRNMPGGAGATRETMRLDAAGNLSLAVGSVRLKRSVADVSSPPTDAELDAAFGDPTVVGSGFIGVLDDNDAGTASWVVWTTGTAGEWFYAAGTKAV